MATVAGGVMNRERLPNRRSAETLDLEIAGLRYTCTIGKFPDGSIAELFLSNHKINSAADVNARDAAITFSIAVSGMNHEHRRAATAVRKSAERRSRRYRGDDRNRRATPQGNR